MLYGQYIKYIVVHTLCIRLTFRQLCTEKNRNNVAVLVNALTHFMFLDKKDLQLDASLLFIYRRARFLLYSAAEKICVSTHTRLFIILLYFYYYLAFVTRIRAKIRTLLAVLVRVSRISSHFMQYYQRQKTFTRKYRNLNAKSFYY